MVDIILASKSPRRQELLSAMGLTFKVVPSDYDEKLDDAREPEVVASELALGKALAVAKNYPESIVIGSDTIVTINNKQLEKPHDETEAIEMLNMLSGKAHYVSTGLAVVRLADNVQLVGADTSTVFMKSLTDEAIRAYVATGDPYDKAGGYGIQSGAAPFVDYMTGNFDTVVGLPTTLLADYLSQLGIDAKPVVLQSPVTQR